MYGPVRRLGLPRARPIVAKERQTTSSNATGFFGWRG